MEENVLLSSLALISLVRSLLESPLALLELTLLLFVLTEGGANALLPNGRCCVAAFLDDSVEWALGRPRGFRRSLSEVNMITFVKLCGLWN